MSPGPAQGELKASQNFIIFGNPPKISQLGDVRKKIDSETKI